VSAGAAAWPQVKQLHLVLSSQGAVLVDRADVQSLRAEDASGGFGLWPGHADFLTVLGVGVLSWRCGPAEDAPWQHCAVRRGVLTMRRGCELEVATREAVLGDDLVQLEREVMTRLAQRQQTEDEARRQAHELEIRALRQLVRPAESRHGGVWP
jgi:F-type H+-transporting ATPase subunit epsilon